MVRGMMQGRLVMVLRLDILKPGIFHTYCGYSILWRLGMEEKEWLRIGF